MWRLLFTASVEHPMREEFSLVTPILEYSTFRAAPGVTEAAVEAAYQRVRREYMPDQTGVLHHDWFRRADGTWVDLLVADSLEAAHRACEGWLSHAATLALMALMEPGSAQLTFLQPAPMPAFLGAMAPTEGETLSP